LFRYEAKWNVDEECSSVIKEIWDDEERVGGLALVETVHKLSISQGALVGWSRAEFGATAKTVATIAVCSEEHIKTLQEKAAKSR
jgi:hypothetical protein